MLDDPVFSVVETTVGRLRGLRSGGIHVFKGVHYGADTGGRHRFMPPQPVAAWSGVRDATAYGPYAPQMPADRRRAYADLIAYDLQPGGMGEDCLVLNVWTPGPVRDARRPVLVHLHGGGFYAGSGNSPQFDGEMLARFGDAVVITINHRIGAFGFLHLGAVGGDRYASAGNAGMLDIVAALQWVHDNVEAFGGDPARVLVFGQSGGGLKTSTLMAMPSARGLFQRAGVMSGSGLRALPDAAAAAVAEQFMASLEVDPSSLDRLHELPMAQLLAAQLQLERADRLQGEMPRAFGPVLDGRVLPRHPFDPDAPEASHDVPLVIGTTLDERAYRMINFDLDDAGLLAFAERHVGDAAAELVSLYRQDDPHATAYLLQARLDTDATFRRAAHLQAERKSARGGAPVWTYLWTIPSPAYGGRFGAPHGVDIGPSLHDIRHGLNGPSDENLRLADQLASAWVSFAATGNPNSPATPDWPAFDTQRRATLVFAGDSRGTGVHDDPRGVFRRFWSAR
ncbi:carboxylesterase/lipase family protein [Rhizobacter sp. LjRoot28]|uniref:carboxylesterase/lipase family protein n=1 Tax=Rhizobacter sp. LjRoot28 TaxID=3342309 RepID=UPI003ECE0D41